MQPGDVIPDREYAPARKRGGRNEHRKIRLAAGRGKGAGEVVRLAAWILQSDDQHVLREPALAACLPAGNAQRVTFLAEQRIATVTGAVALDRQLPWEVHDEAPFRVELTGRVQAAHEALLARDALERTAPGAGHDEHVEYDIRAVGDLDAAARQRRIERPHTVGDHVHGALAHAAAEQLAHLAVRLLRVHPVVVRTGIL